MIGTATYSTDSDFTVLLHKNFTKDDIVISSDIPGRYYEGQDHALHPHLLDCQQQD